jgi:hypothetical protein
MREKTYYLLLGTLALLLASSPYLYGWLHTPVGHVYTGLTLNIDDCDVYLAWMRQTADGSFFQRNLFTTEEQKGIVFSCWFWLLGNLARLTHLPLIVVYHLGRIIGGAGFLWAITKLLGVVFGPEFGPELKSEQAKTRKVAFALVCFASGLGWLLPVAQPNSSIDMWQPEAIGFLSLYYSPLFAPALACIVLFWWGFLAKKPLPAMLAGFLLGNFHTYDVIPLFTIAGIYQITTDILAKKWDKAGWMQLILIGLAALPTTLYQVYVLRTEPIFNNRVNIGEGTWTSAPHWVLLGMGLLVVFACFARAKHFATPTLFRFCLTWAIVGILIAYVPANFQRKLLMGIQIPFCLLAAAGLVSLASRLSGDFPKAALPLGILLTTISNTLFILQDIGRLDGNTGSTNHQPYLKNGEMEALNWMKANVNRNDFVLAAPDPTSHKRFPNIALMPYLSVSIPALGNGTVYNGHWSETVQFKEEKLPRTMSFFRQEPAQGANDAERQAFLQAEKIRYIVLNKALGAEAISNGREVLYTPVRWTQDPQSLPAFLEVAFQNNDVVILRVKI